MYMLKRSFMAALEDLKILLGLTPEGLDYACTFRNLWSLLHTGDPPPPPPLGVSIIHYHRSRHPPQSGSDPLAQTFVTIQGSEAKASAHCPERRRA
jgi:hypothetical protein